MKVPVMFLRCVHWEWTKSLGRTEVLMHLLIRVTWILSMEFSLVHCTILQLEHRPCNLIPVIIWKHLIEKLRPHEEISSLFKLCSWWKVKTEWIPISPLYSTFREGWRVFVWDYLTSLNLSFSWKRHVLEPSALQKVDTNKKVGA